MDWTSMIVGGVFGAIVGAVLSVAADRAWRRMEAIPTVRVQTSCAFGSPFGQRFNLIITNMGVTQLPPYEVVLRHPMCGTVRCFPKTEASDRLPGQREVFSFSVSQVKRPDAHEDLRIFASYITTVARSGEPMSQQSEMTDEEFRLWRLQLVLTHSDDVVLFEHADSGAAIAAIVRDIAKSGHVNPNGSLMFQADVQENTWTITAKRRLAAVRRTARAWWQKASTDPRVQRVTEGIRKRRDCTRALTL